VLRSPYSNSKKVTLPSYLIPCTYCLTSLQATLSSREALVSRYSGFPQAYLTLPTSDLEASGDVLPPAQKMDTTVTLPIQRGVGMRTVGDWFTLCVTFILVLIAFQNHSFRRQVHHTVGGLGISPSPYRIDFLALPTKPRSANAYMVRQLGIQTLALWYHHFPPLLTKNLLTAVAVRLYGCHTRDAADSPCNEETSRLGKCTFL